MINILRPNILPVFVFSFLYSIPNIAGHGWMIPSNTTLWFSAGIVMVLGFWVVVYRKKINLSPIQIYLFTLLILLMIFGTVNSDLSINKLTIYWLVFAFIGLFYLVLGQFQFTVIDFYRFLFAIVLVGGLQAFIGFVQIYDSEYRLFHLWFGYEPFKIVGDATGSFQQKNMLATFLSLSIISGLVLFYAQSHYLISFKKRISILVLSCLMFFILLSTGSRAGLLAFIVPFILFLAFYYKEIIKQPVNLILMMLAFFVTWLFLLIVDGSFSGLEDISNKVTRISEGGDARIHLYTSAIKMFFDSPWFGYGIGGYQDAVQVYFSGKELPKGLTESQLKIMTHPHNELLFWMLQSGVVAVIAIIGFAILFMKRMFVFSDKSKLIILLILPIVIQSMLSYPFELSALHLFLLLVLLSFGDKKSKEITINNFGRISISIFSILLFIFISFGAFKTFQSIDEAHYFVNRMYLYENKDYEGYETKGYFLEASSHPLLKDYAFESMNGMYHKAVSVNNFYDIQQYVRWCKNTLLQESANCQAAINSLEGIKFKQ